MKQNNSEVIKELIDNKEQLIQHLLDAIEELTHEDCQKESRDTVNDLAFLAKAIMMLENKEGGEQ